VTGLLGMPNKRQRRTKAEMAELRTALYAAAEDEQPVTNRRLFYRLETDGFIAKTEAEYQGTIIRLVGQMREADELPWDWIVDYTRYMRKPASFASLRDWGDQTVTLYRRALWFDQPAYVEIWTEKTGLLGVLEPVTEPWDVPLMMCCGNPSKTFLRGAAQTLANSGKPNYIYYLGDHDPSGCMIRDRVERDLRRYAPTAEIHFEQLAVTPEQIAAWNLPTRPTKTSDPNARRFVGDSVEVDAIPTKVLRDLTEAAIAKHIDTGALERLRSVEAAETETLNSLLAQLPGAAPEPEPANEYDKLADNAYQQATEVYSQEEMAELARWVEALRSHGDGYEVRDWCLLALQNEKDPLELVGRVADYNRIELPTEAP
jgi:hypothetical protein